MPNPADTLTLQDLKDWNRRDEAGNFLPSLAVLGHPVAHSVSPQMHNAALAELAKEHPQLKDWCYFKFEIEPEELKVALRALHEKNFVGLNLTIPHKITATYLVKNRASDAVQSGAVNTLIRKPDDGWNGENSDGFGLTQALKEDLQSSIKGREVVLLGTGGAAHATVVQCLSSQCSFLWLGGRKESEMQLDQPFHRFQLEKKVKYFNLSKPPFRAWKAGVLVINATPVGLKPDDPSPIDLNFLPSGALVLDMVYKRGVGVTPFVSAARERGLRAADGLGMLVWQGAKSLSIWIKSQEGIDVSPESIAPTMMTAACAALGLPPRHA